MEHPLQNAKRLNWKKDIVCPEGYTPFRCVNCHKVFIIKNNVPLNQQVSGHTWLGEQRLRHLTREDWLEEQADQEICPVCGVPHGPNPYTGCEIGTTEPKQ